MAQKKLTKRQRRFAAGPNAAILNSLDQGAPQVLRSGAEYIGKTPIFAHVMDKATGLISMAKVTPGIPFIRVG